MKRAGLLLLLFTSTVLSQPKVWVNLKGDSLYWSQKRAAFMYFNLCEEAARETTIFCYIKQGFWWKAPDERLWSATTCGGKDSAWITYSIDYHFSFDSVTGRGDQRKALFSWARKTCDDSSWIWIVEKRGVFVPDSLGLGGGSAPNLYDTLGRTRDSTVKISRWLTYARKVLDQNGHGWYIYSAGPTPVEEWSDSFKGKPYDWYVHIRMEKILGDPTKNRGWDQRAVFKMKLYQMPNDSLNRAVVGDVSTW